MELLVTLEEALLMSKKGCSKKIIPCKCKTCGATFLISRKSLKGALNKNCNTTMDFCSKKCNHLDKTTSICIPCGECGIEVRKLPVELRRSKSGKVFCSRACSGYYNSKNRTRGTRVSKLELWIQKELEKLYPKINFHFNRKDAINSELDVYIPELKLAFELNGIFHYEPIYGEDKLAKIQNNDDRKFQACREAGISFCTIDTSGLKYFKPKNAKKYLDIIVKIMDGEIVRKSME